MAWKPEHSPWKTEEIPLGKKLKVFDAELHDVCSALEIAERLKSEERTTVFLDSQAAIRRLQHTEPEPGQELAMRAQATARRLQAQQVEVTVQWVPGHAGVEGNERADKAAKQAAARPAEEGVISLAHVRRRGTEKHSAQGKKWLEEKLGKRSKRAQRAYRPANRIRQDPAVAAAFRKIAS